MLAKADAPVNKLMMGISRRAAQYALRNNIAQVLRGVSQADVLSAPGHALNPGVMATVSRAQKA